MGCLRPATPGFLITLLATILLAVVVFCVPYFKTIYFLKATISVGNDSGSITFGTLGYCIELPANTTCSSPSIGYQLDINGLVGNRLPVEIPQVAVKWITYALVLHVVALVAAAGSALFGLLAHVREMSMTCCSTCVSGIAAFVAMLAFIVDLILFFVAKARINQVGSAQIGTAIWLTLAAWILLFFSGCFYTIGRCCISSRGGSGGGSGKKWKGRDDTEGGMPGAIGAIGGGGRRKDDYAEQMRLDAVKAEVDRKAAQKRTEVGLPAFYETQPLTARVEGDHVYLDGDNDSTTHLPSAAAAPGRKPSNNSFTAGGYVRGTPGQRAVDEYYSPQPHSPVTSYPPQRQPSGYAPSIQKAASPQPSLPSQGNYGSPIPAYNNYRGPASPAPSNQLLALPGQYPDPYDQSGRALGHTAGGSSYHTATQHGEQPSTYTGYNAYTTPDQPYAESYNPGAYHPQAGGFAPATAPTEASYTPPMPNAVDYGANTPNPYIHGSTPAPQSQSPYHGQERSYTLGGDAYGSASQPQQHDYSNAAAGSSTYYGYNNEQPAATNPYIGTGSPHLTQSPPPIETQLPGAYGSSPQLSSAAAPTSPVRGPRPPPGHSRSQEDAPPGYEPSTSGVVGNWGKR